MGNKQHLEILMNGSQAWNQWRSEHPNIIPNLSDFELNTIKLDDLNLQEANLRKTQLQEIKLRRANLYQAVLEDANLKGSTIIQANLVAANLNNATLYGADIDRSDFSNANLRGVKLIRSSITDSIFVGSDLANASLGDASIRYSDFSYANFNKTNLGSLRLLQVSLKHASLVDCEIYGISTWKTDIDNAKQENLIISFPRDEERITVDNIEIAQFVYLLLYNRKIRYIIDAITSKVVLILGRFTKERKIVLDAIRNELRKYDYIPVLFDFKKPDNRDLTETVSTLAHISRFIIADITDPRSVPQELQAIIPNLPSVPIQPVLEKSSTEYGMFEHFKRYPWVLNIYHYNNINDLVESLNGKIISSAEAKAKELLN